MRKRVLVLAALTLGLASSSSAGLSAPYTPPFVFQPNTLIKSSDVNANFSQAASVINNLDNQNIATSAAIDPNKLASTIAFPTLLMGNASTVVIGIGQTGDAVPRLEFVSDGSIRFGPGAGTAVDVGIYRSSAGVLAIRDGTNAADRALTCSSLTASGNLNVTGSVTLNTPLAVPSGGSGLSSLTVNSIPYGNNSSALQALASVANGAVYFNGSGVPTGGTLPYAGGGTGAASFTNHGVIIGGSSALTSTSAGTSGQPLTSNGPSADPTFQAFSASAFGSQSAFTVFGNNTSSSATPGFQVQVPEQTPQNQLMPFGSNASWRAIPTGAATLTGDYVSYGNVTISGAQTWNRVRLYVIQGNLTISGAITVNTELPGGASTGTSDFDGADGAGIAPGNGGVGVGSTGGGAGGGGGNGGAGGRGGYVSITAGVSPGQGGGAINYEHYLAGSGGGSGCTLSTGGGAGGAGGGGASMQVTGNIDINANITATGGTGGNGGGGASDAAGGGGSGGTVAMICGGTWTLEAGKTISVAGGAGGAGSTTNGPGGGGGGGGRVFARSGGTATTSGTITVSGGGAGTSQGTAVAAVAGSSGSSDVVGSANYPPRSAP